MLTIIKAGLLLAVAVAIGPKQLPRAARVAGRVTGKSVKYVGELRQMISSSRDKEIVALRSNLDEVMGQFSQIQAEVRSGFTLRNRGVSPVNTFGGAAGGATESAVGTAATAHTTTPQRQQQQQQQQFTHHGAGSAGPLTFSSAFASLHQSTPSVATTATGAPASPPPAAQGGEREQFLKALQVMQDKNLEKKNQNPFLWDESAEAEEKWAQEQMRQHKEHPAASPFAGVSLGHQPLEDLYEESSLDIRTETMGSGADILSKNILEKHFAEFHAKLDNEKKE